MMDLINYILQIIFVLLVYSLAMEIFSKAYNYLFERKRLSNIEIKTISKEELITKLEKTSLVKDPSVFEFYIDDLDEDKLRIQHNPQAYSTEAPEFMNILKDYEYIVRIKESLGKSSNLTITRQSRSESSIQRNFEFPEYHGRIETNWTNFRTNLECLRKKLAVFIVLTSPFLLNSGIRQALITTIVLILVYIIFISNSINKQKNKLDSFFMDFISKTIN